jgi:hypothetical protein
VSTKLSATLQFDFVFTGAAATYRPHGDEDERKVRPVLWTEVGVFCDFVYGVRRIDILGREGVDRECLRALVAVTPTRWHNFYRLIPVYSIL